MLDHGTNLSLGDDILSSLYIKNGKDVNNQDIELLIENGKIVQVSSHLSGIKADNELDLKQRSFVSAGWIDDHVHCFEKMSLYYDDPDKVGYETGVTTVIDAGSTGADNIDDFYRITRNKKTNVLAMINISKTGILAQNELDDLTKIQLKPLKDMIQKYPNFIVGLKARISKSVVVDNGIEPLKLAKKIQKDLPEYLPLMIHIGTNPPELKDIFDLLEKGDIVTHCFNGKSNGILDNHHQIKSFVKSGLKKGIIFDVGHGTDSFNFRTAQIATDENIAPQSLSTDIYHRNREFGPVYNMATCIEKMLILGYDLKDVITMITKAPATNYHLKTKGSLQVGMDADITVFNVKNKEKILVDSNGNECETHTIIDPQYSIIAGQVYLLGE